MEFTTSDEHTPGNMIQLYELISVNISITLPEVSYNSASSHNIIVKDAYVMCILLMQGSIPSLTVQLSHVGMLPPNYTVNVTRGEVLHIGEFVNNLALSEGDTANTSSNIIITENLVCCVHKLVIENCHTGMENINYRK